MRVHRRTGLGLVIVILEQAGESLFERGQSRTQIRFGSLGGVWLALRAGRLFAQLLHAPLSLLSAQLERERALLQIRGAAFERAQLVSQVQGREDGDAGGIVGAGAVGDPVHQFVDAGGESLRFGNVTGRAHSVRLLKNGDSDCPFCGFPGVHGSQDS